MINKTNSEFLADFVTNKSYPEDKSLLGFHILSDNYGKKYAVFRVWAPCAKKVFLVGDFNNWQDSNPMKKCDGGIFEATLPYHRIFSGQNYKFKIETEKGKLLFKSDPYALHCEAEHEGASKIFLSPPYFWHDDGYISYRKKLFAVNGKDIPLNIYKITLSGKPFSSISDEYVPYLKQMGYTHLQIIWKASSFSPQAISGTPDDFKRFVDTFHGAGLGVILEWSPNKIDICDNGLCEFDGTPIYEAVCDDEPIFNFQCKNVRELLTQNALYLINEFHIDGLYCDLCDILKHDEMCENSVLEFYSNLNRLIAVSHHDVFTVAKAPSRIKDITDKNGIGFTFSRDRRIEKEIVSMSTDILPVFQDRLISLSDNSCFIKKFSEKEDRFAISRLMLSCMMLLPGKKLTFHGCEICSEKEDENGVQWHILADENHKKHQLFVRDLNALYLSFPILWQNEAVLLTQVHSENLLSFVRINKTDGAYKELTVVINFGQQEVFDVEIKTSKANQLKKVFSSAYKKENTHETFTVLHNSDRQHYIKPNIPPMSVSVFAPTSQENI